MQPSEQNGPAVDGPKGLRQLWVAKSVLPNAFVPGWGLSRRPLGRVLGGVFFQHHLPGGIGPRNGVLAHAGLFLHCILEPLLPEFAGMSNPGF